MGKVSSGIKCSVIGCRNLAERSISYEKARAGGLSILEERKAYLCRAHYKQMKKATKEDRLIEKWRHTDQR